MLVNMYIFTGNVKTRMYSLYYIVSIFCNFDYNFFTHYTGFWDELEKIKASSQGGITIKTNISVKFQEID